MEVVSMTSVAKTVRALEMRRAGLMKELVALDARLHAIARAAHAQGMEPTPARQRAKSAKRLQRRSWFAREEAARLLRKVAKTPKFPAEIVRALQREKDLDKLSADDAKRFQGAAYMAIAQALKTKTLKRAPEGRVVSA
jgi:hypothetical protein